MITYLGTFVNEAMESHVAQAASGYDAAVIDDDASDVTKLLIQSLVLHTHHGAWFLLLQYTN